MSKRRLLDILQGQYAIVVDHGAIVTVALVGAANGCHRALKRRAPLKTYHFLL